MAVKTRRTRYFLKLLGLFGLLAFLLLLLGQGPAQAQASFADSFHGSSLDYTRWAVGIEGIGAAEPQTDGLHMTLTSDNNAPGFSVNVTCLCVVQGDFDAQVEYRLTAWPPVNGIRLGIGADSFAVPTVMGRISETDSRELYLTSMADGVHVTETTDTAGRLRITRTGDALNAYFYSSGNWVLLHSHTDPQYAADTLIGLHMWGHNSTPGAEIVLENFIVTADSVKCPPPFTATFSLTLDEVAPDDPDILPADDECPVGAACKLLWWTEIPDGQPTAYISGTLPSSIVGFAGDAIVPDGAIVGRVLGSQRVGPVGRCGPEDPILPFDVTWLDGTTDPSTTTGSPTDVCSFSHWPTQLDGVRVDFLAANPGAALSARWVGCSPSATQPVNVLLFTHSNGSISYIVTADPTAPLTSWTCSPWIAKSVHLGLSADNPDTPGDEGGIPLRTCTAAGTQTFTVSLDRGDTPPGDPVDLEDTAICSPNTPAGSDVSVPLNGGTEALAGIEVTFSEVASGGSTTVITTTTGPPPPTGFKIVGLAELPLYFDINTDTSYSGDLTVCVRYDESQVAGPEANLKLMHRVDGFVDVTTSVDTVNDIICGTTTGLSIFIVAEAVPIGGIVEVVAHADTPAGASGPSSARDYAVPVAAALAAGTFTLAAVAWYARTRRAQKRWPR